MKKVMIYGKGAESSSLFEKLSSEIDFKGFIISDSLSSDEKCNTFKVDQIDSKCIDYVIISSITYEQEMRQSLLNINFREDQILTPLKFHGKYNKVVYKEQITTKAKYANVFIDAYVENIFSEGIPVSVHSHIQEDRKVCLSKYNDYNLKGIDYVRVSTFELLSREIQDKKIPGAVAELGVYRGNISVLLKDLFENRKIYLFDTFEGFHENDVSIENDKQFANTRVGQFNTTSLELVERKMKSHLNLEICKGYFPKSAIDIKDTFAFVSIDVDLYQPTYEGLKFFYERLNKGGYIVIHDYNFKRYAGVKAAVREFCEEYAIPYIPMSDYFGSVVIGK